MAIGVTLDHLAQQIRSRGGLGDQAATIEALVYWIAADQPKDLGDRFVARISRNLPKGWLDAQAMRTYLTRQPA